MRPIEPLASRPTRRRRLLRPMLVGSLLLHLLVLVALYLRWPPEEPAEPPPTDSDAVAITFDTPTGSRQASTAAPNPADKPQTASGSSAAPEAPPTMENASAPPPAPTPQTPAPPDPQPPVPPAPEPTPLAPPPDPAPAVTANVPPPLPIPPPPPAPTPSAPRPPATVSLNPDEIELPPPPPFQMPQPPPPLPPLPRPPPRVVSRPRPANPFAAPQNWSFNSVPSQNAPGRPSRGFDLSPSTQGGPDAASLGYVSGAKPSGDWMSALRKWVDARKYYPEQAIAQMQQGNVTLMIDIDRSGKVLQVRLADTSQSQFLDGAFEDLFRRATVPPFTPDMTDQTTTLRATMHFRLITH